MEAKKNYLSWSIRIIVSALFILSALAKLSKGHLLDSPYFAISTFEVKQLYTLGFSEGIAPYFSRTLIGIEMALGLLLLQNNWLKRFIVPVTTALLLVFIGHLTYVTFLSGGNSGNCGCFGELLPMTPIEAIIKNIVAVGLLVYLYKLLPNVSKNGNFWILTTVLFASILWIYMLAPIRPASNNYTVSPVVEISQDTIQEATKASDTLKKKVLLDGEKKDSIAKIEAEVAKEPKKVKSGNAQFFANIDTGRKLLCYFVPGCDHCRAAAKELTEMRKKDASLPPLSIIFMNEEVDLIPDFYKEAGAAYPYIIVDVIPFYDIIGKGKDTPGVKYFWNGNEIKYYWGITKNKFNGSELNDYLHKSYNDLKKTNPKL